MKFTRVLAFAIPAALAASVALAVPASAHHLEQATLSIVCDTKKGEFCVTLAGTPASDFEERNVTFALLDQTGAEVGNELTFDIKPGSQFNQKQCFNAVSGQGPFQLEIKSVTDSSGQAADITIVLANKTISIPGGKEQAPVVVSENLTPCVAVATSPSPSPSPSASPSASPSPSASASPAAALAQTGGFDFRLPLIGMALLAAGGAIFVVGASRGRTSS